MKLASYVANGRACFGAVTGEGVITLNDRLGAATPRLRVFPLRLVAETGGRLRREAGPLAL